VSADEEIVARIGERSMRIIEWRVLADSLVDSCRAVRRDESGDSDDEYEADGVLGSPLIAIWIASERAPIFPSIIGGARQARETIRRKVT